MYTAVAFLTLDYMYNPVDPGGRQYVLIKYEDAKGGTAQGRSAARTARIARLIEQFGIESIMRWEGPTMSSRSGTRYWRSGTRC